MNKNAPKEKKKSTERETKLSHYSYLNKGEQKGSNFARIRGKTKKKSGKNEKGSSFTTSRQQ